MEFKNKISTSVEQSKKLLEWGLNPETADMCYHCDRSGVFGLNAHSIKLKSKSLFYKVLMSDYGEQEADKRFEELYGSDIPSWSLSRLIELMPEEIEARRENCWLQFSIENNGVSYKSRANEHLIVSYDETNNDNDLFENFIGMIGYLIRKKYFNKEYLNKNM